MKKIISTLLALSMLATNVVFATDTDTSSVNVKTVATNISEYYSEKTSDFWLNEADFWHYLGGSAKLTSEEVNEFIYVIYDDCKDVATGDYAENTMASKYLRAIFSLSSLGLKTGVIIEQEPEFPSYEDIVLDHVSLAYELSLLDLEVLKQGYFSTVAPFVVIALAEHNNEYDENAYLEYLTSELPGTLTSEWGPSVDSYAMILQGLVSLSEDNVEVLELIDSSIEELSLMQGENGSFGNANADAMVITLLSMLGIDSDTDSRFIKNENSLIDGLFTYLTADQTGFTGYVPFEFDDYATKQALVALNAYIALVETGEPVNAYTLARDTAFESMLDQTDLSVDFTFNVPFKTLIDTEVLAIDGTTVYDVIKTTLETHGYELTENDGYISGVTGTDVELFELTAGANSGFLYRVNGETPQVSASNYVLLDGDVVNFYFTGDYSKDVNVLKFDDVELNNWYYEAVDFAVYNGLFNGVSETSFDVYGSITHEMFLTVLHRLVASQEGFEIEELSSWSEASLIWANSNGLVLNDDVKSQITRAEIIDILYAVSNEYTFVEGSFSQAIADGTILGRGDGTYGEEDFITRAETAMILMRYLNK